MTTPLLAIGLLSRISSAARHDLQRSSQTSAATTSADAAGNGQNVPGQGQRFDLNSLFKTLDADGNGSLSQGELKNLPSSLSGSKISSALLSLQESGQSQGTDLQSQLFSALDQNSDGQVNSSEFQSLAKSIRGILKSTSAAGDRGAAGLGAGGLKPASATSGVDVDRDSLNRAVAAYGRTSQASAA